MFNRENLCKDKVHIIFKQKRMLNINRMLIVILINAIISFFILITGSIFIYNTLLSKVHEDLRYNYSMSEYNYNIVSVINKVNKSIVSVSAYVKNDKDLVQNNLTGVIYSEDGYILTNFSAIKDAYKIYVKFPTALGLIKEAKVVGYNAEYDICLLKINGNDYIKGNIKEDLSEVSYGLNVISIGNSLGKVNSYSIYPGIVSGINLYKDNSDKEVKFIKSNFHINYLNTGGPICNTNGEIIGISSCLLNEKFKLSDYESTYISSGNVIEIIQDIIEGAT
ncbi:S1C family serine protease [Candidatus Arthromitus sp. SFB-rat-Yit]|uniref:S1C family serine protease n=1 Tax=Candidatus Arthromitus sp. SFB-rat-Yit TaxID=1041504 RepID=UPI0005C6A239|nr:S1C family serine protease [Candidatus Arthromitus sp. SFB-rat-Yit]